MKTYRIEQIASSMNGTQVYECEAESKEEALEKFNKGKGFFITEELEITDSHPNKLSDIEEIEPWDKAECNICGDEIFYTGEYWEHTNHFYPHYANPKFPKFVKYKCTTLVIEKVEGDEATYYRNAGNWDLTAEFIHGKLKAKQLSNGEKVDIILETLTEEEFKKEN